MKRYKKETGGKLEIGQSLYTKQFKLTVDRELCKGCELCKLICPKEAISLVAAGDGQGSGSAAPGSVAKAPGSAVALQIDIDEGKCDFHGICAAICPFSAIKVTINGVETLPSVEKEAFPLLERDIRVRTERCPAECKVCEEACPLGIIKVRKNGGRTTVDVSAEKCAGCRVCWMECPEDAISVSKFIEGSITVRPEKCPDGCRRCVDACPVDAMGIGADGKVFAKEMFCIYCGACVGVCPESVADRPENAADNPESAADRTESADCPAVGALEVTRISVRHTPVDSGTWHRGLEKITSPEGLARELAGAGSYSAQRTAEELAEKRTVGQ